MTQKQILNSRPSEIQAVASRGNKRGPASIKNTRYSLTPEQVLIGVAQAYDNQQKSIKGKSSVKQSRLYKPNKPLLPSKILKTIPYQRREGVTTKSDIRPRPTASLQ